MLVLNLACGHDHCFEGWFASAADYESQLDRALISCPVCADEQIRRLPSAPHLNLRNERLAPTNLEPSQAALGHTEPGPDLPRLALHSLQRQALQAVQQLLTQTEDVGDRFAEEARRIHYGESETRSIRGQASRADAEALVDEGIEIMALPMPAAMKGPIQ